jgi:flagellar biosynthesis protein FliQ
MVGDAHFGGNRITMPFIAIIFLAGIVIAAFQHFTKLDFGVLGIIAWIIIIVGAIYFILWVLAQIFG